MLTRTLQAPNKKTDFRVSCLTADILFYMNLLKLPDDRSINKVVFVQPKHPECVCVCVCVYVCVCVCVSMRVCARSFVVSSFAEGFS